jgi:coniferyl-aldehyde dehydrogenase
LVNPVSTADRSDAPGGDARFAAALLDSQRGAHLGDGPASAAVRMDRLDRALTLLLAHQDDICTAVSGDFGQRAAALTQLMDIFPAVHALKFARRHVRRWMRPRRQGLSLPIGVPGTRAHIFHQPLGVVGVISPWNFPVTLTFGPLAGILAAGNRCLIKLSESTPRTAELLQRLIARHFDALEVAAVTGGPDVAQAFSSLPFDHLIYTGSTSVGRRVMGAAAQNLVPVTLELGGKCPAVIGRSADLNRAVDRIMLGKLVNAGQMCLAPDYVCVPRDLSDAFVDEARLWSKRAYPGMPANADYTSLINDRQVRHMNELLGDARAKGARVISLAEEPLALPAPSRLMAPALILGAREDMRIMQEEIFAPLLPLREYDRFDDVIGHINRGEPPLALYYFGNDGAEERELLARTRSGGVTINDVAMHFLAEELPFGGIGASGMGAYHGEHGFRRFSHARAVFRQTRFDVAGILGLRPPYGAKLKRSLRFLIRR